MFSFCLVFYLVDGVKTTSYSNEISLAHSLQLNILCKLLTDEMSGLEKARQMN